MPRLSWRNCCTLDRQTLIRAMSSDPIDRLASLRCICGFYRNEIYPCIDTIGPRHVSPALLETMLWSAESDLAEGSRPGIGRCRGGFFQAVQKVTMSEPPTRMGGTTGVAIWRPTTCLNSTGARFRKTGVPQRA